jgi:hypothetical protein
VNPSKYVQFRYLKLMGTKQNCTHEEIKIIKRELEGKLSVLEGWG